jgi:MFS transporter, MHS family, proline/betaine transporter
MLFSSLRREQREAVGLLQIGTFLEYFDLMLYVHMAVLLNDLFFPKTDPHTASLIAAFAFCSNYVLRPFGALLFGWIGDHIGRKTTVIITTMMMAISCLIMANLPTYSQIGISAAWIITLCRIVQGLSTMGEVIGAEIYLTEITKPPARYPIVASTSISTALGFVVALGIATLVTNNNLNWRIVFWIGSVIAVIGSVARTRLRETPDFVDMKKRMQKALEESRYYGLESAANILKRTNIAWKEKISIKTGLAYFFIQCGWPVSFYFIYIYCSNILKNDFGLTPEQVIHHNLMVSLIDFLGFGIFTILSIKIYPLIILKLKASIVLFISLCFPYIMPFIKNSSELMMLQWVFIFFTLTYIPAGAILYNYFPVYKRFTFSSLTYATAQAIMYVTTAFGLVYLTESFGHYGLWFIMIPISLGFLWGVFHFESLEKQFADQPPRSDHPFSMKPLVSVE